MFKCPLYARHHASTANRTGNSNGRDHGPRESQSRKSCALSVTPSIHQPSPWRTVITAALSQWPWRSYLSSSADTSTDKQLKRSRWVCKGQSTTEPWTPSSTRREWAVLVSSSSERLANWTKPVNCALILETYSYATKLRTRYTASTK